MDSPMPIPFWILLESFASGDRGTIEPFLIIKFNIVKDNVYIIVGIE